MSLLDKLQQAVNKGIVKSPFTTQDLKKWINTSNIINDDSRKPYSDSYIEGFLSSSTIGSTSTKHDKRLSKSNTIPGGYRF